MRILGGLQNPDVKLSRDDDPGVGAALAIFFTEESSSDAEWTLFVDVRTAHGRYRLGRVVTTPPSANGGPPSRIVATAFCPGAIAWSVTAVGPSTAQPADLELASSECCADSAPGVTAVPAGSLAAFSFADLGARLGVQYQTSAGLFVVGGKAALWQDQSGHAHGERQATAANRPLVVAASLNNLPGLQFVAATPDFLTLTEGATFDVERTDPFWFAFVAKSTANVLGTVVSKRLAAGLEIQYDVGGLLHATMQDAAGTKAEATFPGFTLNQNKVVVVQYDGSGSAFGWSCSINGVAKAATIVTDSLAGTTKNTAPLALGVSTPGAPSAPFNGLLYDTAGGPGSLSAADVARISRALGDRFRIG